MDLWDGLMLLSIVLLAVLFPRLSPCTGCMVASEGNTGGDLDCRRDCTAFIAYNKKYGRD